MPPAVGGFRERSEQRVNSRNGYRLRGLGHPRRQDRAPDPEAAIRRGYLPEWVIRNAAVPLSRALVSVVATSYLLGVSDAASGAGRPARRCAAVEEPGLGDGQDP